MSNADKDIAFQVPVEMQIAFHMARLFPGSSILPNPPGKVTGKDFTLFRPLKFEVKCDYAAKTTGNLFFEIFNPYRNIPSGLTATEAWRWIHYVPGHAMAYCYSPSSMLAWLKWKQFPIFHNCGDNNSDGYLATIQQVSEFPFVKKLENIML